MFKRGLNHVLIALAILAAQWAGLAHSIEHRHQLQSTHLGHLDGHAATASAAGDLLHSCLLFDGLTTASTVASHPPAQPSSPLLAELGVRPIRITQPRNMLFSQRVRVRDPPRFS